jgi:hypothetical protein
VQNCASRQPRTQEGSSPLAGTLRSSAGSRSIAGKCDGIIARSHPSAAVLGAYLDAILARANEFDAHDIAKVIERRPRPLYEERMAVFLPTGKAGAFA